MRDDKATEVDRKSSFKMNKDTIIPFKYVNGQWSHKMPSNY